MSETAFTQWHEWVGGAFALQAEAFRSIASLPNGLWLSLLVVLLSGLSLAVGQSIILFINRVKPARFVFSLILNAVLFTFGFVFLTLSTWLICLLPWSVHVPFLTLLKVLGLGYAPLLFSFLGALPYVGYPLQNLFSVWNLLAMVVGFAAITNTWAGIAFGYVAFGWFVKQLLEGTIGQPIARWGKALTDRVAGVNLADNRSELRELVLAGTKPAEPILSAAGVASSGMASAEMRQLIRTSRSAPESAQAVARTLVSQPAASTALNITQTIDTADPLVQMEHRTRNIPQPVKLALSLLAMAIVFVIVLLLLRPIRDGLFGWYKNLPGLFRLVFDLVWIGVVAIVFAGILAPLESLGWWAGWYGDSLDTTTTEDLSPAIATSSNAALSNATSSNASNLSRYLVYLDGIGQSGAEYTPDVEDFLVALEPALPKDIELVKGLMLYSVLNRPLDEDRPLAFLWKTADKVRWTKPTAILGILVNLRNVLIVAVSSDKRYGPIYNQGIAQVIFDGLIKRGYQPGSGVPITLLGYSGGGEMSCASAPYLRRSTGAPIEVISLGGVMSANNNFLKLEHLYHVVGDNDPVERSGPVMFPGRWKLFPLSYWNRAKRKGKITILSAGAVGHQVPGGYMDPQAHLPSGETNLQHTIEIILQILRGKALTSDQSLPRQVSNYALYREAAFNRPEAYPIAQSVNPKNYQPIGEWMGRLILPQPEQRSQVQGVRFEVHYAPAEQAHLIGQIVKLRWDDDPIVQRLVQAVTKDVHFSADAEFSSQYGGSIHPDRLNHWRQVNPLESLAGSHPVDDIIVKLPHPSVQADTLYIRSTPVQITGRFYGLVQFTQAIAGTDQFRVVHFDRATRQFQGDQEIVRLPEVVFAKAYGSDPSTTRDLEKSPFNEAGWYVYGAQDGEGMFVVQAIAPRSLFQLQPQEVVFGRKASYNYIRKRAWANIAQQKGKISSVLCTPRSNGSSSAIHAAIQDWAVGDRALVLHTYGGIGGNHKEPAAATPIFFGHFAYGQAEVVHDPLADELRFDICYHQVYTQNTDGLVAGTLHWSRYMGDRQFGWAGTRPTCDILIKLDAFTEPYTVNGVTASPLNIMMRQLQVMTARYRIGDGTGGTYVGPANNCAQDSNQALFASIRRITQLVKENPEVLQALRQQPDKANLFKQLQSLGQELELELQPLGGPRADWEKNEYNLGSTMEDNPLRNLWIGLGSWRTMLPRLASDTIVNIFLNHDASVWVLRTNQIGGTDPDIEPIAPMTL